MKKILDYQQFSNNTLNEGILSDAWVKVAKFFKKKYDKASWFHTILYLKKRNELPKGVEFYTPNEKDIDINVEPDEIKTESKLNEDVVELTHYDKNISNEEADEIKEAIVDAYNFRLKEGRHSAIFLWGAPGIGKTDIVNSTAEKLGLDVITFHLSQIEPTEFRGIPKIENLLKSDRPEDERTVNKLPSVFPTDNGPKNRGGILFLDELNRAPKMVLSAALPLCLDGKIGDYTIPDKWIIIAAGNRKEDIGFDATEIEPALANRFLHINFVPTVEKWTEWAVNKDYIDPDLISFLVFYKDYFHKLDPEKGSSAWPSPRAWSLASQFIHSKDENFNIPDKEKQKIYTRAVGTEAAVAFMNYLKLRSSFNEKDVEEVYTKGAKAKKPPKQLDQSRAAMASIAFWKKGQRLTQDELKNVMAYALQLPNVETKTSLISFLKTAHTKDGKCYLREEEPWKTIYWDTVKQWHNEIKNL